jgi:hypothetical protein
MKLEEGIEFMLKHAVYWNECMSFMFTHNWFHVALFYLDLMQFDHFVKLFDDKLWVLGDQTLNKCNDSNSNCDVVHIHHHLINNCIKSGGLEQKETKKESCKHHHDEGLNSEQQLFQTTLGKNNDVIKNDVSEMIKCSPSTATSSIPSPSSLSTSSSSSLSSSISSPVHNDTNHLHHPVGSTSKDFASTAVKSVKRSRRIQKLPFLSNSSKTHCALRKFKRNDKENMQDQLGALGILWKFEIFVNIQNMCKSREGGVELSGKNGDHELRQYIENNNSRWKDIMSHIKISKHQDPLMDIFIAQGTCAECDVQLSFHVFTSYHIKM